MKRLSNSNKKKNVEAYLQLFVLLYEHAMLLNSKSNYANNESELWAVLTCNGEILRCYTSLTYIHSQKFGHTF